MSVLIKNVEMPMHCAMCGFHGAMGDPMISQHFCKVTGENILTPYKGRLLDCPLVEIPPHGRLIDADALRDNNSSAIEINSPDGTILAIDVAIIDDAPTIIPASEEV